MAIYKINLQKPERQTIIASAETVKNGGVIIYPSDTCYGIGADATNPLAREKIERIKGREPHKPLSVIVRDLPMIKEYAVVEPQQEIILKHYLPGSYTFILLNKNMHEWPFNSIGVRIPNHPITQSIANQLPMPFVSTSANISGEPAVYSIQDLEETLLNPDFMTDIPDLILDAGPIPENPPSTIVDLTGNTPRILRQGSAKFLWPIKK